MRKLLLLLPLLVALLVANNVQSRREADALRRCVTDAQSDLRHLLDKASSAEQYGGAQLTSPNAPPAVRRSLAALVTGTVSRELPALRRDRAGCDYRVLPWHATDARDAYTAYLDARLLQLQTATQDRDALHEDPARAARVRAQQALRDTGLRVSP